MVADVLRYENVAEQTNLNVVDFNKVIQAIKDRVTPMAATMVALRVSVGFTFLWPFLDKFFGLGFDTAAGKGWIDGGSPTFGFLKFGTQGPFAEFYQGLAGLAAVDFLYMVGMLAIGTSLILGAGIRLSAASGALMMALLYTATMMPTYNPFIDQHIILMLALAVLAISNVGQSFGLGSWWASTPIVKRFPVLL